MAPSMIDEVFELLALAGQLEDKKSRIEAATKYYEAVYLMRRYLLKKDKADISTRQLIEEKVVHYEQVAAKLMADDSSTMSPQRSVYSEFTPLDPPPPPTALHPLASQSPKSQDASLQKLVGLANQKLSQALDLDEALQTEAAINNYMEAAHNYLEALKGADDSPAAIMIKRRLESTLDRIEILKQAPSSSRQAKVLLPQKRMADDASKSKKLSTEEVNILKASSLIASGVFLPWSDDDATALLAEMKQSSRMYKDPSGFLALSDTQKQFFDRWARPSEIARIRYQCGRSKTLQEIVVAKVITPYTIRQKYVTDCSFVASLCICANFERRFKKRLVTSVLYPQTDQGELVHNPTGKYMVKLWLNGVARCVVVDDYLPIDKYGNLLCSHSSDSHAPLLELWVCLIEKAFLKLSGGGYGFPGSNSGVDMFALTGWIPETVLFAKDPDKVRDFETPPERAWERIMSASSFGDCLITVSSELDISEEQADAVGLVTGHAYAVLNVMESSNGTRLLQLKNPWAHKGWKGRFSSKDDSSWNDTSFQAEMGYDARKAAKYDDGVFWICWDDVLRYFQNFHLSWNPELFSHRTVMHGLWPKSQGPAQDTYAIGENPQYIVEISDIALEKNPSLWILLSRHVTKEEQLEGQIDDYLTVHLHKNNEKKQRKWYPGRAGDCIVMSAYTNSPHVLVRYDISGRNDKYISLVLSQFNKVRDIPYTLSVFCTGHFSLSRPPKDLVHCVTLDSSWIGPSSGGSSGLPNFENSPMFSVLVETECFVEVRVTTGKTIATNILLIPVQQYGDGFKRATSKPILDSGRYRHGFAVTGPKSIKPGPYLLVISSFHEGQKGVFQLKVYSSRRLKVQNQQ